MAGYTHANPDYDDGTGTVKDTNAGLYGTYLDNSGVYVDTVAKYVRMRNNFNVKDTLGQKVDGNAKSNGYSLSVETGKRFAIQQSNFYVESQLQLSYTSMGDATTHASNGLKVKLDSYDSLLGRGSIITGYQIKNSDNPNDLYIKTGYVREFMGNTSYKLNDNKEKHDFGGGWFDSALGVNAQFNKRHNIYSEVSYSAGSRFDKQQINLGYRYQF